ncbi:putative 8-oxo-dGTP diphosphatase 1 [Rhodoplanes serenus]|uniref:8-oxo-dGTP diphosphatase 1 n=1 Tax=Rhodoplanes serenus TaxID=200615 RepID=A0A3S4CJT6_9BRAD|nr:NUDIX domain-containing protein [Rhodoplanes serenus]VCU10940.1 putative 8-oxo-dGTP diphosphatase 1 [Rhodoplanes serenus]
MTRSPIAAAGGILTRSGPQPLIALVQRRRDDVWVLPKGKLEAGEQPIEAAVREVKEETGHDVAVHEFLGVISYQSFGTPKIARFWRMTPIGSAVQPPTPDIRDVTWLPLPRAIETLTQLHEKLFLESVAAQVTAAVGWPRRLFASAATDAGSMLSSRRSA